MGSFTATEIAFLLVACQQFVLAGGWAAGSALLPSTRAALLHWAGYALLSGISLVIYVGGMRSGVGMLRDVGNLSVIVALLLMHRGVRAFFGLVGLWWLHLPLLIASVAVIFVGLQPERGPWRVGVISGGLMLLCLATAWDLQREARRRLELRWAAFLAVPLAAGSVVFGYRMSRAALSPETIIAEVMANSSLNVGSALVYLVVALTFQLTLVALVVSRLVGELQRSSRFDGLTGMLNRRAMQEEVEAEAQRARRLGEPFALLMIDVDRFKAINDRDGHAAGDRALQHLGTVLSAQMREIDRVGRWGGEEFVVLLPGTRLEDAALIAERLRARAEALPPRWQERELRATLSIGVSQWHPTGDDANALLARADEALYRAKAAGRNCVQVALPPDGPRVSVVR